MEASLDPKIFLLYFLNNSPLVSFFFSQLSSIFKEDEVLNLNKIQSIIKETEAHRNEAVYGRCLKIE